MHFIKWLLKRFFLGLVSVPKSVYNIWREMLVDARAGGTILALIILSMLWFSILGLLAVVFNASNTVCWIWTGLVILVPIGTIVDVQYKIYRREVESTFDELKRQSW